ncbi:GAF and ANTAR domain-containing protein [Nocardia sp. CA-128927]|uniref:GAF and ANTAR domain-containing protein n=1 Tax=Nocardia sp. CA-128927 TaxID=3239975 RepID=UPI003D990C13
MAAVTHAYVPETQLHLVHALSVLTTSVVEDCDPATVLSQINNACLDLLDAAASGIILADPRGAFGVAAASDERARLVELLQSHLEQGPCVDAIRKNQTVEATDLGQDPAPWPAFAATAIGLGYRSLLAVPMRLNAQPVGGLNILYQQVTEFGPYQRGIAEMLAELAVLLLTRDRNDNRAARLAERTLGLLYDRTAIGHAIGILAGTLDITPTEGRALLERYARIKALPLRETARSVTDGVLTPAQLASDSRREQ